MAYEGVAHQRFSSDRARANQSKANHHGVQTGPKWCVKCGRKWKQDGDLCRECSNEVNGYKDTRTRDAERLERHRIETPAELLSRVVVVHRFEIIDHVTYEIWNGDHWYGDKEKCKCDRSQVITTGTA